MTPTGCNTADHERVLAQVLVGDLDRKTPEVRALLAECGECRANFEELTSLAELMELEGQEERDLIASLDYDHEAPGSDLVAPFFEERLAAAPAVRPRSVSWLPVAAAAAVLVGAGLWLMGRGLGVEASSDQGVLLGSSDFKFNGATGIVEEYGTVTWDAGNLSSADRFEIRIFDATSDTPDGRAVTTFEVGLAEWTPTDEQKRTLPEAIRVEVAPLDLTGQFIGASGSFSASRSR